MTLERQVRAGSWKTLKILAYLPAFRGGLAQMLYDITHIWSLPFVESCPVYAEALCQVTTICHLLCMANWWQLWGEMMCWSRNEVLMLARHFWQLYHHLFTPPVNVHISGLCHGFFITLLAPIHWTLCHFPRGTPSLTIYFCIAWLSFRFVKRTVKLT